MDSLFSGGKTMSQDCCQPKVNRMILVCSGGSNVGQLANRAGIELTQEGFGKLSCLAGVGAHLSGFVRSAQDIPELVVIDGCEVGCARGVLEQAEVPLRGYLVITDLDIDKNKDMNLKREEIDRVKEAVRRLQSETGKAAHPGGPEAATCGCGKS
jgi:uncharacterized metal-binding protein